MNEKVKLIIVVACLAIAGLVIVITQTDILSGGGGSEDAVRDFDNAQPVDADTPDEVGAPEDGEGPIRVPSSSFGNSR